MEFKEEILLDGQFGGDDSEAPEEETPGEVVTPGVVPDEDADVDDPDGEDEV